MVRRLFGSIVELVMQLMEYNATLLKQNEKSTVRELKEKLNKNSQNSFKPASSGALKRHL